jgi:hypothetical protein
VSSSAYWYYGLILISLILLTAALIYKKDWKILVLHLNVASVIHPFEIIVLILFNGYRYLPGILPDARLDNYLGSYVSNSLIIPASAVIINAFSLSWSYSLSISAIFAVTDWYFATLGIYQHFWWRSFYTGIGLLILYAISKWIWKGLQKTRPSLLFKLFTIYLSYAPLHNFIVFISNKGGQLFRFHVNWFGDPEKAHQIFFFLHLMITSLVITLCIGLKLRLRYRMIGIAILAFLNWTLEKYHIFVPTMMNVTGLELILVSVIAVPIIMFLFKLAKLDYLFP